MKTPLAIVTIAVIVAGPALAQETTTDHNAHHAATAAGKSAELYGAEVRKVDKEASKITLKHEAMPNLDMPPMTMVFRVSDPKLLDQVKAGDKVRFSAQKVGGQLTVTQIEPAQ